LQVARYGITTGKKVGKAVQRNRSRRLIREAFRLVEPQVKRGYDYVFVARVATNTRSSIQLRQLMQEQLKKAGFLQ
jgi:ribonuclease P protein component